MNLRSFLIPIMTSAVLAGCYNEPSYKSACDCEEEVSTSQQGVVSAADPQFIASTYIEDGGFTADASCHADMILYYRWADPVRAATTELPCITYSFGTVFGYFTVDEDIVTYHDSETGIYSYRVRVNKAADKSNPDVISYSIQCNYDVDCATPGEIMVTGTIQYRLFDANEHLRTDNTKCDS